MPLPSPEESKTALRRRAQELGFQVCRIAAPDLPDRPKARYQNSLERGDFAAMDWLAGTAEKRLTPRVLWPDVQSIVVLGLSYAPAPSVLDAGRDPGVGRISVHALSKDYHEVLKGRAKTLGQWITSRLGGDVRVYVDSAPVLEKPLAEAAGLGWQGRSTLLINQDYGAWLLLAEIFTSLPLTPDAPVGNRCAQCTRCVDACPTKAIRPAGGLDARRCLAYLTTEEKGQMDPAFREQVGNRIYGCDECLRVCPWNRFATPPLDPALPPREDRMALRLSDLLALDEAGYRTLFAGSGVRRLGYARFCRNVLIAAGNSGEETLLEAVRARLTDPDPLIADAARWAWMRLQEKPQSGTLAP